MNPVTDPRIVTDADTVARLAKKARAIGKTLDGVVYDRDKIILIEPTGGAPMVACVGERNPDGTWIAVAIETGDIWHYDGTGTGTGTPKAATAVATVHDDTRIRNGRHHFSDGPPGHCLCLGGCCNDEAENCICAWGCDVEEHEHHRGE